ncbi:hypothetical protein [Trichothermofontia sp.]
MLPLIVQHDQVFPFRFWLNNRIQEGLHYRGELFCHLQTFETGQRARVYHLACKLAQQGNPTLLLLSPTHCSLWISLRSSIVEKILLCHFPPEWPALLPALPPMALPSSPGQTPTLSARSAVYIPLEAEREAIVPSSRPDEPEPKGSPHTFVLVG